MSPPITELGQKDSGDHAGKSTAAPHIHPPFGAWTQLKDLSAVGDVSLPCITQRRGSGEVDGFGPFAKEGNKMLKSALCFT
jgi:hypothetical protein